MAAASPRAILSRAPGLLARRFLICVRVLVLAALGRCALHDLSLGVPRLWLAYDVAYREDPLLTALRRHRRRLWRRRAAIVLARLITIALTWLLLANLAALFLVPGLPVSVRWTPVVVLAMSCAWLAVAQHPTLLETAQLLDRWCRLHNTLGTALEMLAIDGLEVGAGDMPEMRAGTALETPTQLWLLDRARAQARTLPVRPWPVGTVGWRPALLLLIGAALSFLPTPRAGSTATMPPYAPSVFGSGSAALHSRLAVVSGSLPARFTVRPGAHGRVPVIAATGTGHGASTSGAFAASFQVRAGSETVAQTGAGEAPRVLQGSLSGGDGGNAAGQTSQAGGMPGQSHRSGAGGSNGAASSPGQSSQQGSQGSPQKRGAGSGSPGSIQAPQQGPRATTGQNGNQSGQPGQNGTSSAPSAGQNNVAQSSTSGNAGQPSGGQHQANPFGQDPAQAGASTAGGSSRSAAPSSRAPQGAGQRTGQRSSQAAGRPGTGHAPQDGGQDPSMVQRGRGLGPSGNATPRTEARKGSIAMGGQVGLGGHLAVTSGNAGAQLVRIVPGQSTSGGGLGQSAQTGSPVVQGYVPENDTTLSPDEQGMVRSYFGSGGGP